MLHNHPLTFTCGFYIKQKIHRAKDYDVEKELILYYYSTRLGYCPPDLILTSEADGLSNLFQRFKIRTPKHICQVHT